jgi:PAS domain S-box-containing protein
VCTLTGGSCHLENADETRRKPDKEALRPSEQKFRELCESMIDGSVVVDMTGRIQEFNAAFQRMLDYPGEELRRLTHEDVTPNQWHAFEEQILRDQVLPRGYSEIYEKEYQRKNGTMFPVELRAILLRDESGRPAAIWAVVRDITERRKQEEDIGRLRFHAWRADRRERMGALAASLAHDLRQPLDAVLHNAQAALRFLEHKNPDLGEIREILNDIVLDDRRASAVISGMSNMLRRKETTRDPISLAATIQETLDLMHGEIVGQGIQSGLCRKTDCVVSADKAQIQQVLISLVTNAIEAMQGQPAHQRRLEVTLALTGPDTAQITVSDSGPGIPDVQSRRLFDPFWATGDQGMGISLSLCRFIVQAHGGNIWYINNQNGGAAFSFTLPLVPAEDSRKPGSESGLMETPSSPHQGNGECSTAARILLVDDSAPYRRALWSMLADAPLMELAGEAADGTEAVKMAQDLKPDLILLDVRLPGMNGIEAASQIQLVSPKSKMLFLSQYDDPDVIRAVLHTGALGYVLKAAAGKELLPAVAAVLRGERFLSADVPDCDPTDHTEDR